MATTTLSVVNKAAGAVAKPVRASAGPRQVAGARGSRVQAIRAFESERSAEREVSLGQRVGVAGASALAALSVVLLQGASPAEAKVVLERQEPKKVFQSGPKEKRAPKPPRAKKQKGDKSGGGFSAPTLSAPSISFPSIGSGPLASFPAVIGSFALTVGGALAYAKIDDGFMDFIGEAMAKDVSGYVGNEEDLKN
mmetsp:Transcript_23160/g.49225  ORF Transcript_23160/g.49225 Transcript_23160/m.49225 type:complete len:195 (-) Transcript_23160:152-736(-)